MCVFNFFFWKSWLAGEEDYLLQKKKLKVGFCGCSDTRRAFSRACIAKCAYHKPPLRGRWAALPRCAQVAPPRGAVLAAARRRGAEPLPRGGVLLGLKRHAGGPAYKKNGISFSFQKLRPPFQGPNALDFIKQNGLVRPEIALDRAARA